MLAPMNKIIDLRSDTVTQPCKGMRQAMYRAEVGDDVYGEDPTVSILESRLAEMTGKQAGLFCPSGTQSNLIALLTHCQRGDEYIVGNTYHAYKFEAGGAAVLGSIQPQPVPLQPDRTIALADINSHVKMDDIHLARTRLLSIENTCDGRVLSVDYLESAIRQARTNNLLTHLDGARLFNASVELGVSPQTITKDFDSVSICLSKGLGAPVGSVLVGSIDFICQAKRWRKMTGGGMRQAGVLAAAGLYALENNIDRLSEDHQNARLLAELLDETAGIKVEANRAFTNMVFTRDMDSEKSKLFKYASDRGLMLSGRYGIRMVTHLGVNESDIHQAIDIIRAGLAD